MTLQVSFSNMIIIFMMLSFSLARANKCAIHGEPDGECKEVLACPQLHHFAFTFRIADLQTKYGGCDFSRAGNGQVCCPVSTPEGSDVSCPKPNQIQCLNKQHCVSLEFLCDGQEDCSDNFDESPFVCKILKYVQEIKGTPPNTTLAPEPTSLLPSTPVSGEIKGSNCKELLDKGMIQSSVYTITPKGFPDGVKVYCDQETSNGGWTVMLRRHVNQTRPADFTKSFEEYSLGFGDPNGELWIGNRVLNALTDEQPFTLRVDAKRVDGESRTGIWENFRVGSEETQFTLSVADYSPSSTLGDALWKPSYSGNSVNNMKFSTNDRDNDKSGESSCSAVNGRGGGWWYNSCGGVLPTFPLANKNGEYYIAWWRYWENSLPSSSSAYLSDLELKIKPKSP